MMRSIVLVAAVLTLCVSASAQTQATTSLQQTASENLRASRSGSTTPASIIRAARERHNQLVQDRVHGRGSAEEPDTGGTDGTSGTSGGLNDLLGSLLGNPDLLASLGSLGGLSGLLGGGTTGTSDGTGINVQPNDGSSDTTSGSSTDTGQPDFSLEDLLALEESLMGQSQVRDGSSTASKSSSTAQTAQQRDAVKQDSRSQTTTTPERSFRARLFESWAGAIFTALTVAFQQRAFIDLLADQIRPLMTPPASGDGDGSGSGDGDGTGNGGTDGNGDTLEGVVQAPWMSASALFA